MGKSLVEKSLVEKSLVDEPLVIKASAGAGKKRRADSSLTREKILVPRSDCSVRAALMVRRCEPLLM